jgi:hypothetical protein
MTAQTLLKFLMAVDPITPIEILAPSPYDIEEVIFHPSSGQLTLYCLPIKDKDEG